MANEKEYEKLTDEKGRIIEKKPDVITEISIKELEEKKQAAQIQIDLYLPQLSRVQNIIEQFQNEINEIESDISELKKAGVKETEKEKLEFGDGGFLNELKTN